MIPAALIFDVDGTLAETEELHRAAFNAAFREFGIDWSWNCSLYGELLSVAGGKERIAAYADRTGASGIDIAGLHRRKNMIYGELIGGQTVELRPGVERLIRKARDRRIPLAIATTTSRGNVEALISATLGGVPDDWFASVRCGEDATAKKPDPAIYRMVLADLGCAGDSCVAFEDSANGLLAAKSAGIPTLVTPSLYTQSDDFSGAALILRSLAEPYSSILYRPRTTLESVPGKLVDLLIG